MSWSGRLEMPALVEMQTTGAGRTRSTAQVRSAHSQPMSVAERGAEGKTFGVGDRGRGDTGKGSLSTGAGQKEEGGNGTDAVPRAAREEAVTDKSGNVRDGSRPRDGQELRKGKSGGPGGEVLSTSYLTPWAWMEVPSEMRRNVSYLLHTT